MVVFEGIRIASILLFVSIILTLNTQCQSSRNHSQTDAINAKFNFFLKSLEKSSDIEDTENIFFSPHSIYEALKLMYVGARSKTEKNLKKILGIPKPKARSYENLTKSSRSNYDFITANRLFISSAKHVRLEVLNQFDSQIERVHFKTNPSAVRRMINNWVKKTTKGNIQDLIPSDGINKSNNLVLVNAVYFKGLWANSFKSSQTHRGPFFNSASGNLPVHYMEQIGNFKHRFFNDLSAQVLEMPYEGNDVSMFVFLPEYIVGQSENDGDDSSSNDDDGIKNLIKLMTTGIGKKIVRSILNDKMNVESVKVTFPKFTLEKELPMDSLLDALGAGDLLKSPDLRDFVYDKEGLHLDSFVHKAKIELNEEGTTAAAATAGISFRSGHTVFNANHPFVYIIYDKKSQSVLFTGIYRSPDKTVGSVGLFTVIKVLFKLFVARFKW